MNNKKIKGYIISLAKSEDRRKYIQQNFSNCSEIIDFNIHEAVDGSKKSIKDLTSIIGNEKTYSTIVNRQLSEAELGCLASHVEIWKKIINKELSGAFIFEDDAILLNEDRDKLINKLNNIPPSSELIYWGFRGFIKRPYFFTFKLYTYFLFKSLFTNNFNGYKYRELFHLYSSPYNNNFSLAGAHHGSHAYWVSNSGAKKLLNQVANEIQPADITLGLFSVRNRCKVYNTKENIFKVKEGFSSTIVSGSINRT